jgi:hypothetical protein
MQGSAPGVQIPPIPRHHAILQPPPVSASSSRKTGPAAVSPRGLFNCMKRAGRRGADHPNRAAAVAMRPSRRRSTRTRGRVGRQPRGTEVLGLERSGDPLEDRHGRLQTASGQSRSARFGQGSGGPVGSGHLSASGNRRHLPLDPTNQTQPVEPALPTRHFLRSSRDGKC